MKQQSSYATRIGTAALAAQMLITACIPAAFAQEAAAPPRRGEPITLNFTNAEIESVARTMAVVTGRDVVVDPRVKGTINLQTDRAISPAAAFNQFAAALRLQGFAIVQSEGLYKVVPEADAKLQSSAVSTSTPATATLSGNQIVTQVFKLNYESANNLLPVLRPLIAPNNTINVNPGNNSLVITDYAENLRRWPHHRRARRAERFRHRGHSVASTRWPPTWPVLTRLVEGGSCDRAGQAGGRRARADRRLVPHHAAGGAAQQRRHPARGQPARWQLVRSSIDRLDRAPIDSGNGAAGNIHVVYLKNADAVRDGRSPARGARKLAAEHPRRAGRRGRCPQYAGTTPAAPAATAVQPARRECKAE
jgi:general secretion pathway protein D